METKLRSVSSGSALDCPKPHKLALHIGGTVGNWTPNLWLRNQIPKPSSSQNMKRILKSQCTPTIWEWGMVASTETLQIPEFGCMDKCYYSSESSHIEFIGHFTKRNAPVSVCFYFCMPSIGPLNIYNPSVLCWGYRYARTFTVWVMQLVCQLNL